VINVLKKSMATATACLLLSGVASVRAETAYVFATFKGDAAVDEKLWIYTSANGTSFDLLSNTFFAGSTGVLRDPSIMKHTDGKYYIAYTVQSWTTSSTYFAIASSTNLINWTQVATVNSGIANTNFTWAPEWFVENGTVRLIVSIAPQGADFKPYVYTATDSSLTNWSSPVDMGIGTNKIDTFVVKSGGVYHAFAKNETTKYIEHATASSLLGPWTWVGVGNWANWGSGYEAPALAQMENGQWRLYIDKYPSSGLWTATSSDLTTWTGLTQVGAYRHGTVLRDTQYTAGHPPSVQYVSNRNSGKVLDVQNPNQSDGANVGQYTRNNGPWQQWRFYDTGTGYFTVVSANSGKCLDVSNASTADNADIVQWTCNGGTNQQWQWGAHGSDFLLKARHSGKCAGVVNSATTDGADVRQQPCNAATSQDWVRQP
jgi:hypothetical protein